jgi:hypothetical protein
MPVETIQCQQCGSADVTEFKPGSYVCGHCEAVFKHIDPMKAGTGCEVDGCGVLAIGRCKRCESAYCASHGGGKATCEPCVTKSSQGFLRFLPTCELCGEHFRDEGSYTGGSDTRRLCLACRYGNL